MGEQVKLITRKKAKFWEISFRAIVPPITLATTFQQYGPGETSGFEYGRTGNPTRSVLEEVLAALDNAKYAVTFASGLGTQTAVITTLKAGDGIISSDNVYGGVSGLFKNFAANIGLEVQFVDMTDLKNLEKAMKPNVKLVWFETPTNPTIKVIDIRRVVDIVHSTSKAFVVVDNTFLSAYFQRPLDLGADVVMYSLTKFMNGHADVTMGSIATNSEELYEKLKFYQNATGIVPSPFDCYMVIRGLKSLPLRMERHFESSTILAKWLEAHPKVEKVLNPALASHPQHDLAKAQSFGHSGIMAFYIKGATVERSTAFLKALKIFALAYSLGGSESLAQLPSRMTHINEPLERRQQLGITDGLIRISIGLEDVEDLIKDLDQALAVV